MKKEHVPTPIHKLSEFVSYLEKLPNGFTLSRGHSKDYSLLPGAFRKSSDGKRLYSKHDIQLFLDDFRNNSYPYLKNPTAIYSEKEWMVYAQHFGIPTKLLDFTYSHITSLMFSLENAFSEKSSDDGIIWFLNPKKLNLKSTNNENSKIYTISDNASENALDKANGPIAATCKRINERIHAQNGLFVYFQEENYHLALEEYCDESILRKITINKEAKKEILKSLHSLGMGYTSIYPELQSVSKDILLKKNIEEYVKNLEENNYDA
ncbi:FRG domain-containing protein [Providencia manganoxydans]|uniref:FRG domain-containing protein n=1 Tax=Providencia manganoxydans TaxID=2923283 RepID=UPI0032DBE84A